MKIRLVMPICTELLDSEEKYYCIESANNKKYRLDILENAMIFNAKEIDLVVTSNNYFYFNTNNEKMLTNILQRIKFKKDIVIGVDYLKKINPIGGIKSKIYFFKKFRNKYICKKSIWETYPCNKLDSYKRFKSQQRVIKIKNKKFCFLSCGDITKKCLIKKDNIPDTDVYLDLAHMNYPSLSRKQNGYDTLINRLYENHKKIVILTQQFSNSIQVRKDSRKMISKNKRIIVNNNELNKIYFNKELHYKYVSPKELLQEVYMFNDKHNLTKEFKNIKYFFVDVEI